MRTDRELLELAAKAAGIEINLARTKERDEAGYGQHGLWTMTTTHWNPLTDDGDALRLAVTLRLSIIHSTGGPAMVMSPDCAVSSNESAGADEAAITRRAIVRAAAEIGAQAAAQQNGESKT
jgi:hypothetical protein